MRKVAQMVVTVVSVCSGVFGLAQSGFGNVGTMDAYQCYYCGVVEGQQGCWSGVSVGRKDCACNEGCALA